MEPAGRKKQEAIPISDCEIYAFSDLAAGKESPTRYHKARQTIIVGARDWLNRWFILESWAGRETATTFKVKILEAYEKWNPKWFGLEANGMQVLFGALVRDEGKKKFGDVRFIPIYQPKAVSKIYRIKTGLQPIMAEGRLFIKDMFGELAQEIRGFPTAKTMDLVDSLETMIRVAPKRPQDIRVDHEKNQYASYLRGVGCPGHQIQEKLAKFDLERQNRRN